MSDEQTIYGDGHHEVVVGAERVCIWDRDKQSLVDMSRAAFREVVIGWDRLREREEGGD